MSHVISDGLHVRQDACTVHIPYLAYTCETPPLHYCSHVRYCSVQCAIGRRNQIIAQTGRATPCASVLAGEGTCPFISCSCCKQEVPVGPVAAQLCRSATACQFSCVIMYNYIYVSPFPGWGSPPTLSLF